MQPEGAYPKRVWLGLVVLGLLAACAAPPTPPPGGGNVSILKRASKSGAIAITGDDKYVVQVNPENDSITIIRTSTDEKLAELPVGNEPVSVVIAPDDKTAYVAVRGDATVVKIQNINTNSPQLVSTVNVGSEPTGLALSPRGEKLVVAEFAEGRISLIDTATMNITTSKPVNNPRALAISNNGDQLDSDEKVVVTEFYGRPTGQEASDSSRTGAVRIFGLSGLSDAGTVLFEPLDPGDFVPTSTAPNQLASVVIAGDKFYATAVGASPDGAPKFNENVFPLLLIGKLDGSKVGVVSLADEIKKQVPSPRNFMADLYDLAPVGDSLFYLLGRGADAIQRVVFTGATTVSLGATVNGVPIPQIDLLGAKDAAGNAIGCQNPIGVVTPHDTTTNLKMYVDCWVSRTASVVNLQQQKAITKIATATPPAAGLESSINKGRRFYFTGTGRWSNEAWSSCGSCHPDGLSDSITWRFAAGPRQSTSMDGTFSHGPGSQKQRILNWTGIFEELHDFERNTRDVSGGIGALVKATDLLETNRLSLNKIVSGVQSAIGGLEKPLKELQDGVAGPTVTVDAGPSVLSDWNEINEFVKTIRPPRGKRFLDAASVARGRDLFANTNLGNCASCHGGAGWTLSRLFWTPSDANNAALAALDFTAPGHTKMIQAEQGTGGPFAPAQVACVLRKVDSFGVPGDAGATNIIELKAGNPPSARAQGEFAGYNIPSLYGLQVGAPFLHHGQAKTLSDLLTDAKWNVHLVAGNPVFNPTPAQRQDLVNFLFSIDPTTAEVAPPTGSDKCPASFP